MSDTLPAKYADLLEAKALVSLATLMPDGSPQVTPVWFDWDGTHLLVNSAKGRQKDRNMRERPQVAAVIVDPANSYRYLAIRGRVAEITEEGAAASIDKLAKKYLGKDKYPWGQPGEVRVLYKILPEHGSGMG